jgi:hypothetical protein
VLRDNSNVHFLGTQEDMDAFSKFVNRQNISKVVDENGEPLAVWHSSNENFSQFDKTKAAYPEGYDELGYSPFFSEANPTDRAFFFSTDSKYTERFARYSRKSYLVYLNIRNNFDK